MRTISKKKKITQPLMILKKKYKTERKSSQRKLTKLLKIRISIILKSNYFIGGGEYFGGKIILYYIFK